MELYEMGLIMALASSPIILAVIYQSMQWARFIRAHNLAENNTTSRLDRFGGGQEITRELRGYFHDHYINIIFHSIRYGSSAEGISKDKTLIEITTQLGAPSGLFIGAAGSYPERASGQLRTGDQELDRRIFLSADDAPGALDLLRSPAMRAMWLELLGVYPTMTCEGETLRVELRGHLSPRQVERYLNAATQHIKRVEAERGARR